MHTTFCSFYLLICKSLGCEKQTNSPAVLILQLKMQENLNKFIHDVFIQLSLSKTTVVHSYREK